ncbi:ATP-binding protein [Hymenobacter convexus]|uniref:ATP-binding protein n=1 Tax=Hymenobacter sp. CA1UV-4 TaxID=3063782 RepID=UPI002713BF05|nr:ATP-binding protein [Hymenobacter sp. CA1UV-4]MDO7854354.1 ATP-binding protein [Hymenobacter sp. CA1UV-4]
MATRLLRFAPLFCLLVLLGHGPLAAQTPMAASFRYWDAPPDSLRKVLAGQHSDTARLRTLLHLVDLTFEDGTNGAEVQELAALTARLKRPERTAYAHVLAGVRLAAAQPAAALDTLKVALAAFDSLGRSVPQLVVNLRQYYNRLNQPEARRAFYEARLAYYLKRGDLHSAAACYHGLGGYYVSRGDYNQAVSNYLRSADGFRRFSTGWYFNELQVVGANYALWGNFSKSLQYLRLALRVPHRNQSTSFIYRSIAAISLHDKNYPAAWRYADSALVAQKSNPIEVLSDRAYGLLLKSTILLAQHRTDEAGPLLEQAQQIADSLQMPLNSPQGAFELDATWARYYAALGQPARAAQRWKAALRQSLISQSRPLRLAYLRELARCYRQQGQAGPAADFALAAVALADTLETNQGNFHVAQYEAEQADRAQTARIAGLRQTQLRDEARARQQRLVSWVLLGGVAGLLGLAAVLYFAFRRSERLGQLVSRQKQDLQIQRDQLNNSLTELRTTQAQLIQREKMASLGELTAGIAHEIQNPLNFVNNFADVSAELVAELQEAQAVGDTVEVEALAGDVAQNLTKICHHGRRAAAIVRGMLDHSRTSAGERAPADLNRLADEYLRLAYQGLRAADKSFNATLETDLAPALPRVPVVATDLGRVLLNLFGNAFYAVRQRQQAGEAGYAPTVRVRTRQVGSQLEIRVQDNGTGMPADVLAKIFQPFFTTKPTGQGTGLGLSLSYDIVTQGHGGTLTAESQPGQGSEFVISLPL